jgi:hypothetical protein
MKRMAGISMSVAVVAVIAGCGGGGGGGTSATGTASAGGSTAVSSAAAQRCLTKHGFEVQTASPTTKSMRAVLYVNQAKLNQVYLAFLDSPAAAAQIAKGVRELAAAAGGNAGAEIVGGTVVLGRAKRTSADEVARVKRCLLSS